MRVLLTGHLGYIGTVLAPMLLKRGHDVVGLDSDLFRACTFLGSPIALPAIEKDVRDATIEDVEGFDAVIHLAGLSNDPLGDYRPGLTDDINRGGSVKLGGLAKTAGVKRFLFASSCSNYGAAGNDFLTEDAAFNPVTPYGQSKVDVERAVIKLADETFSPTFLRASTAYGLSPRIRFDLVVNNLAAWAFATGEVRLKSDGMPWRPLVHVEDISAAYIAALEAERDLVHGKAFNVGSTTENYRVREVAEIVHELLPESRIGFAPDAAPDIRNYRVDCGYIARTLHGFKPQWTVRRGVEQLINAYAEVGVTVTEFEGPKFRRIDHIRELIARGQIAGDLRRITADEKVPETERA
jgi:nucleoside-diphosphate-sugar epimerase